MDEFDAVRARVMEVGVRRTTLSDVARQAGVSRVTLYRRHTDLQSMLGALVARDFGEIIAESVAAVCDLPTARERLVAAFIATLRSMSRSPLVLRILEVDPELMLPYVTDRIGQTQRTVLETMEVYIVEGQTEGSIRSGDPGVIAACLELTGRSFVFSARARERACDPASALDGLHTMVDAYLRPPAP